MNRRLVTILTIAGLCLAGTGAASASEPLPTQSCASANLDSIFLNEFKARPLLVGGGKVELTWSASVTRIAGHDTTQAVPSELAIALSDAFTAWSAGSTRFTVRQASGANADMLVGVATVASTDTATVGVDSGAVVSTEHWGADQTWALVDSGALAKNAESVRAIAAQVVGLLLGLGRVPASPDYVSVLELGYPDNAQSPSEHDLRLVRQLYGEPVCDAATASAGWAAAQSQFTSLKAQLSTLTNKASTSGSAATSAAAKLQTAKAAVAAAQKSLSTVQAKLKRICAAKPKPRGC